MALRTTMRLGVLALVLATPATAAGGKTRRGSMKGSLDSEGPASSDKGGSKFLSARDVALHLGVSEQTVTAWCRKGILPALRPKGTRKWRIRADVLQPWLRAQEQRVHNFLTGSYRTDLTDEELIAEHDGFVGGDSGKRRRM